MVVHLWLSNRIDSVQRDIAALERSLLEKSQSLSTQVDGEENEFERQARLALEMDWNQPLLALEMARVEGSKVTSYTFNAETKNGAIAIEVEELTDVASLTDILNVFNEVPGSMWQLRGVARSAQEGVGRVGFSASWVLESTSEK
ncbi:hypothetical protein NBRC116584_02320 [Hydrogenophaga sp. 5NK40-0174]